MTTASPSREPIVLSSSSPGLPSPSLLSTRKTIRSPSAWSKENAKTTAGPEYSADLPESSEEVHRVPFTEIIGNFGYSHKPGPKIHAVIGDAPTKRRRIELAESSTLAPVARERQVHMMAPALPKTTKSPSKKKPQTITALATAAYLSVPEPAQSTTANSTEPLHVPKAAPKNKRAAPDPDKVKRPRKPRAKKTADADGVAAAAKKPNKVPKVAKAKPKPKAKTVEPKQCLYTPSKATEQMIRQDFLFGTSSQLAGPESPSFIRQLQTAIIKSDSSTSGPHETSRLQDKSCYRVPSAPHGTNLSIGQASRELWCSAARDATGAVSNLEVVRATSVHSTRETASLKQGQKDEQPGDAPHIALDKPVPGLLEPLQSSPLCISSDDFVIANAPLTATVRIETCPLNSLLSCSRPRSSYLTVQSTPGYRRQQSNTSRTLSDLVDLDAIPPSTQQPKKKAPVKRRQATEKKPPVKKTTSPKKLVTTASPDRAIAFVNLEDISDDEPAPSPSPPRRRGTKSPSPIKPLQLSPSVGHTSKPPPSKAKVKAIAGSSKTPSLSVTTVIPVEKAPALMGPSDASALSVTAMLKPTDAQWQHVTTTLYPRITRLVQNLPPSTGLDIMNWHEKMLLYDPIILEDFTAWLNEQNITITVRRRKRKSAAKTKKRKAAEGPTEPEESTLKDKEAAPEPVIETEIQEEPLQSWMVQRWCESQSICCCSKDTFNGNARAKYQ